MRKHLQSLFTFGFWKIHVGYKSNTVWLVIVTIAHRCCWKNNKRMDLWFFLPCIFPLCCLFFIFFLPFWINNELAATKISGLCGRWALNCLKILCCILSFGHRLEKTQLCSSCTHKISASWQCLWVPTIQHRPAWGFHEKCISSVPVHC